MGEKQPNYIHKVECGCDAPDKNLWLVSSEHDSYTCKKCGKHPKLKDEYRYHQIGFCRLEIDFILRNLQGSGGTKQDIMDRLETAKLHLGAR